MSAIKLLLEPEGNSKNNQEMRIHKFIIDKISFGKIQILFCEIQFTKFCTRHETVLRYKKKMKMQKSPLIDPPAESRNKNFKKDP